MGELRDKDIIKTKPLTVSALFALPKELDEGRLVSVGNPGDESGTDNEPEGVEQKPPGATGTDTDADTDAEASSGGTSPWSGSNRPSDDPYLGGAPWYTAPFVAPLDPQPLHPPREIKIKSQTPRFNPDGTYVVDVILEFSDAEGAQSYEVRLAT